MLAATAGLTLAWLAFTGVLVVLVVALWLRLSRLKEQYARERKSAAASCLRRLALVRMRCSPGEWHSLHGLVQDLAVVGNVLQPILDGLAQGGYVTGPRSDPDGDVYYRLTPQGRRRQLR